MRYPCWLIRKEVVSFECGVRGLLFGDSAGWVHRIKADLTYVDLDAA